MSSNNMEFLDKIKELLGEELNKSGTAFYSNIETLKKGKYLIIGLNPGGDPDKITCTIGQSFQKIYDNKYNAYNEHWLENGKIHRLQKNLHCLFNYLNEDIEKVCATNLIYERTRREKQLSLAKLQIYENILSLTLDLIQPEIIFTFGKRTTNTLLQLMNIPNPNIEAINSGHGKWAIKFITCYYKDKKIKIVAFPHLSIYTLYTRQPILEIVKKFVNTS